MVLATIMLLVCSLSSFADAEQAQVGFMNDPISIAGRNESYEEYFQNEHGFYLDNSSQIANVFTLTKENGTLLFSRQSNNAYYNGQLVTGYVGNQELLFFCVNQTIYRYHVLSKKIDTIFQETSMCVFYPLSSECILWGKIDTQSTVLPMAICDSEISEDISYFIFNSYENKVSTITNPSEAIRISQCGPFINYHNYSSTHYVGGNTSNARYTVNGVYLPHPNYQHGSYWDGAEQCVGFAKFIYRYAWGALDTGVTPSSPLTITYSNLQTLGIGSMLRFSVGHSAILLACNSVTSVWYDANWNYQTYGENRVAITAISYSTSQSRYGTIVRYMKH